MIITYNHEAYIAQAIESVLMQETEYDFEINIVEDCSTDGTQQIIRNYKARFPERINTYLNAKNVGTLSPPPQKVFYEGFKTLKGDYLAILEGDDYWTSPHKLQRQVAFLEANPDFVACAHNTVKIYEDGSRAPHRFMYCGQRGDATIEDTICLRSFFHTTGLLYRNVFKGIPPRQYRSKWSCDIFILISHAAFGKVRHIDEDMAVYRAHAGGQFSGMPALDGWFFNIDGLRRYNAWLGFRHLKAFSESIVNYCEHVLRSHGRDGAARLSAYQTVKVLMLRACYRLIFCAAGLPSRVANLGVRRATLSQLPPLPHGSAWDLVWGLSVETMEAQKVVADHPVMMLTTVDDPAAQDRHALSECISGIAPGHYRVAAWVKSVDGTGVQLQLRDSVNAETGRPGNEGEIRCSLAPPSVFMASGLSSPGIEDAKDGWKKVSADIYTGNGSLFLYLGLLRAADNTHVFRGDVKKLLFGGIEVSRRPAEEGDIVE